jgi:branched-chain amino acid transport system permease protein
MQILMNGIIQGLLLALVGMGFALVYNATGIFHVAQGVIFAGAPFILLACIQSGLGWPVGVFISLIFAVAVSCLYEAGNHWPLQKKEASKEIHLIASLGVYIALVQLIAIIWGNETRVLRSGVDATFGFAGVILTRSQLLGGAIAFVVLSAFLFWLWCTDIGLRFRALADNPTQLSLMGYNIRMLRLAVFALSGLLTATAALLMALDIGFDPHSGLQMVLLAMVATIIGGRGSFFGAVVGGMLLGVLRSQVVWYTSARWEEAATFFILVLVLFFRPQGLFGRVGRLEAQP